MKPILFLLNMPIEGPGTIKTFLEERNISFTIRDLYNGQPIPSDLSSFGALVVLGGPMNVDEEEKYPFLREEKRFIREGVTRNIPILGICLGAQLLAASVGACVRKNEHSEIGWMSVDLTEEGKKSTIFKGVSSPVSIFQWHGDAFEIPPNAKHLAYSSLCRNQAFGIDERFFGLQFHIEVNAEIAEEWAGTYLAEFAEEDRPAIMKLLEKKETEPTQVAAGIANRLYTNFFVRIAGY